MKKSNFKKGLPAYVLMTVGSLCLGTVFYLRLKRRSEVKAELPNEEV